MSFATGAKNTSCEACRRLLTTTSECEVVPAQHYAIRRSACLLLRDDEDEVNAKDLADAIARAIVDVVNEKTGGGFAGQVHMVEGKKRDAAQGNNQFRF